MPKGVYDRAASAWTPPPMAEYPPGRTDDGTRYEWANLTGAYHDTSDYARMCVSCHRRYDAARRRLTGERTSPRRGGGGDV